MYMVYLVKEIGCILFEIKKKYFVKIGDDICIGGRFLYDVKFKEMLKKVEKISDFSKKYVKYFN